ncbi:MAG: DUF3151 domain-containing protein [Acidimicrobiales bacterium]
MSPADVERSDGSPIRLTTGLPETLLPDESPTVTSRLETALTRPGDHQRHAVSDVVRGAPTSSAAWAALGSLARDDVEAYACFRVGYHRGLDALRRAGWRGSGYVRWAHEPNRGFLRCLEGLRGAAAAIGETEEEERCAQFLTQLDPSWRPDRTGNPI